MVLGQNPGPGRTAFWGEGWASRTDHLLAPPSWLSATRPSLPSPESTTHVLLFKPFLTGISWQDVTLLTKPGASHQHPGLEGDTLRTKPCFPHLILGQVSVLKPALTASSIPAAIHFCRTLSGSFSWLPWTHRPLQPGLPAPSAHSGRPGRTWSGLYSRVDAPGPCSCGLPPGTRLTPTCWATPPPAGPFLVPTHFLGLTFSISSPGRLPGPTSLGSGPLFGAARAHVLLLFHLLPSAPGSSLPSSPGAQRSPAPNIG